MKRKRHEIETNPENVVKEVLKNGIKNTRPNTRRVRMLTLKEKIRNEAPDNEFVVHEIVLATIPGFCPWPARIIQIIGQTIMVEFFGTGQVYVNDESVRIIHDPQLFSS